MENVIMTLGQAALLLASVIALLALLYVGLWLASAVVRLARRLGNPWRSSPTIYRAGGGVRGSARKWQ
jgi:hypothetical protein